MNYERSRCKINSNYRLTCLLMTDIQITEYEATLSCKQLHCMMQKPVSDLSQPNFRFFFFPWLLLVSRKLNKMIVKVNNNFYSELFFHVHATFSIEPDRRRRWPVSKIKTRLSKSDVKNSKLSKSLKSPICHQASSKSCTNFKILT